MNIKTIWIDHHDAYIFEFSSSNKFFEKHFSKKETVKKNEFPKKFTHGKEHQKMFYHAIAKELGTPEQVLILGPGIAKDEFKHHCETHHHDKLALKIVSTIPMRSHPRKSEILKASKDYFDKYFHRSKEIT
jgi:stalled ribosome rescue protein Dom34